MDQNRVLAGVSDLMFSSKISETARHVGVKVDFAGSPEALLSKTEPPPALIILDLNQKSLNAVELVGKLKSARGLSGVPIVGFANHEHTDLMAAAKQAGCREVLTRGAFSSGLARLLGELG